MRKKRERVEEAASQWPDCDAGWSLWRSGGRKGIQVRRSSQGTGSQGWVRGAPHLPGMGLRFYPCCAQWLAGNTWPWRMRWWIPSRAPACQSVSLHKLCWVLPHGHNKHSLILWRFEQFTHLSVTWSGEWLAYTGPEGAGVGEENLACWGNLTLDSL